MPQADRVADILAGRRAVGEQARVHGWIRTRRDSKAGLSFLDATNVYADGLVRYQMRLGIRRTESTSAEEFIRDAHRSLQQNETEGQVRVANAGTKVTISMTKVEDKEIEVEFRDSGNSKHKIRLKFDNGIYFLDDVKRLIDVCFADSEAAAKGKATVTISLGMTVDEVIKVKGAPKTRVDLGGQDDPHL